MISGTAVIQIYSEMSGTVHEVSQTIAALGPGGSIDMDTAWNTADMLRARYTVVGYVLYGGQSTEPAYVQLESRYQVVLPLVFR